MLDPADKVKGKRKEKRKGPSGQRGCFTAVMALLILVALCLLTRGSFIEQFYTPTVPPPPTEALKPIPTVTPIAVPPYRPLILTPLCTTDPVRSLRWRISNENPYDVTFKWIARSLGTWEAGNGMVPAAASNAGTVELTTFKDRSVVTMTVSVENRPQTFTFNVGIACTATPSSATQAR